jgi:hypothetical protein
MSRTWIAVLLLGAAWTRIGWAVEVQGTPAHAPIKAPDRPSAIRVLEAETRASLEALETEAARGVDPEAAQRRVMEVKAEFELARLEILARECREQGREAEALEAEARLESLRNPQPRERRMVVELSPEEKAALEARLPRTPRTDSGSTDGAPSSEEGGAQ